MIRGPMLVAVVDDDESVRESLPDLLRELGFAAHAFASAQEFLESGVVDEAHCLVLDIAMPGMSGPDLQQELQDRRKNIPIVFITAHQGEAMRIRASGAECLFKPFSERAFEEALHGALGTDNATVFVVDDDVSVRESLELLIGSAGWRVETFACAQEFLARPRSTVPCCLVLDVSLPDLNGLELQARMSRDRDGAEMPIVFITGHGDVPMTVRAMKAGAIEFLTKPFNDSVLLSAIRGAIDRSTAALSQETELQALRANYASLSRRERQVMTLVVSGLLNKQVGGKLGISEITVKAHRGKVMRKMKAGSLPELVNMARRIGSAPAERGAVSDRGPAELPSRRPS